MYRTARLFECTLGTHRYFTILAVGVAMTALAYLWMGRLSNLPEPQRIFGGER